MFNMALKLTPSHKKRAFHWEVEQAVYVPSTTDKNKQISQKAFQNRVKEVKRYLSDRFGGYTAVKGTGGYHEKKKGLIQERVVKVVSFADKDSFKKNKAKLLNKLGSWQKKWHQDSIGYEHEGDMYYFKGKRKKRKISPALRKKLLKNLVKARRKLNKRR